MRSRGLPERERKALRQENIRKSREQWQGRQADKAVTRLTNAKRRMKRSAEEQIAALDARLGKGMGAKRERARLAAKIAAREEVQA